MRHFLALLFLAAGISWGQTTPDCQFTVAFSSASPQSPAFNNKPTTSGGQTPCTSWVVTYWTNGASGVSLSLQGAPDSAGSPGSYTALTAVSTSANPATGTAEGNILACCDYYPWIRINPTTFTGTSQTMIVRVYGYRNNNVARGGGGGTLQLTQDVLAGPGTGSLAATVVGINTVPLCSGFTPTNGQFIQYTTAGSPNPCYTAAAASSTLPASIVTYTPGSSVTLTCPSATAGTVTVFAPGNASPASYTALAANMTISWASCTAGQDIKLAVKQAATGGPYTVSGLPSGAPQISPVASVVTTYTLHAVSATAVAFDNVAADSGPGVVTESAAPGTPPATYGFIWDDSTNHVFSFKNPSAVVSNTSVPQTCSANQAFTAMSAAGVYTCAAVTAVPSGSAGGDLGGTYPNPTVTNLSNVTNASLKNSGLVNAATTVNGQTCTLGSICTVTAAATSAAFNVITSGTNTVAAMVVGSGAALSFTGTGTLQGVAPSGATGTGNLVFHNSPTFVTPALGVASGTSLALGGATIGSQIFSVVGTSSQGLNPVVVVQGGSAQSGGNPIQTWNNAAGTVVASMTVSGGQSAGFFASTSSAFSLQSGSLLFGSGQVISFSSTSAFSGSLDVGVSRVSAGVIGVGAGAAGSVAGQMRATSFVSASTTFTASGCSVGTLAGGASAGTMVSGTSGTCTVAITLPTAPTGWACSASDRTTPANLISQSASSTTSCTITGTTISGDVISFSAIGY